MGLLTSLDHINCHIIDVNGLLDESDKNKQCVTNMLGESGRKIRHLPWDRVEVTFRHLWGNDMSSQAAEFSLAT